jgi:hypothetical protein
MEVDIACQLTMKVSQMAVTFEASIEFLDGVSLSWRLVAVERTKMVASGNSLQDSSKNWVTTALPATELEMCNAELSSAFQHQHSRTVGLRGLYNCHALVEPARSLEHS